MPDEPEDATPDVMGSYLERGWRIDDEGVWHGPDPKGSGDDVIRSLDGVRSGRFIVTTWSGTRHLIDFDTRTVVRIPGPGREWTTERTAAIGPITPDREPLRFVSLRNATVGESMRIDNFDEWRITSEIIRIERAPDDPAQG